MTKQDSKQSVTQSNPDKTRQHKPLVPLTEAQLEAISGGIITFNHNETVVKSTPKVETSTSNKNRLQVLNLKQLESVAGGPMVIVRKEG